MLDVFKQYAINIDAEVSGVWRSLQGAEFLIARMDNKNFNNAVLTEYEKHREKLEAGDEEADNLSTRMMAEIMADTIILDWKGVGFKGKELPYSRANVIMLFTLPEMRDFRSELVAMANDVEAYRIKEEEAQAKNS